MSHLQRILVVDDDREIVRLVRAYLEQNGFQVSVAYDGETALELVRRERPALLILDLMLPDRDGWDITRTVRAIPTLAMTPIIMLTARVEQTDRIVGLELGADDYVVKPFDPREVVARVRAVLRRVQPEQKIDKPVYQINHLVLDVGRREVRLHDKPILLTPAEFDILRVLMANAGYTLTRSELIEQAFGYDYEAMERTLDSHVKNLRRKIEPDPRNPTYVQTVFGYGYRLTDASP